MSNQLRLLILIVVISGALCTVEDYVIMSQCAHNKAIHLAAEGTVSVADISQTQNITIVGLPDYLNNAFKIALYAKDTQRYLCFNENWKLVGMKELQDTCYFNETIAHGYFVFRSVVDLQRRVGFTHRGKAVGPKKSVNDACYLFTKIQADQFFHQHFRYFVPKSSSTKIPITTATEPLPATTTPSATRTSSHSTYSSTTAMRMTTTTVNHTKSTRNKDQRNHEKRRGNNSNNNNGNQNKQLQQQHSNGHNSNRGSLSHTKQQKPPIDVSLPPTHNPHEGTAWRRQQQRHKQLQHHQVRHHHNDPNMLARRQQHEHKQKRQQQRNRTRSGTPAATAKTSPLAAIQLAAKGTLPATATTTQTAFSTTATNRSNNDKHEHRIKATIVPVVATPDSNTTTTTIASKRKGRRRKGNNGGHQKKQQWQLRQIPTKTKLWQTPAEPAEQSTANYASNETSEAWVTANSYSDDILGATNSMATISMDNDWSAKSPTTAAVTSSMAAETTTELAATPALPIYSSAVTTTTDDSAVSEDSSSTVSHSSPITALTTNTLWTPTDCENGEDECNENLLLNSEPAIEAADIDSHLWSETTKLSSIKQQEPQPTQSIVTTTIFTENADIAHWTLEAFHTEGDSDISSPPSQVSVNATPTISDIAETSSPTTIGDYECDNDFTTTTSNENDTSSSNFSSTDEDTLATAETTAFTFGVDNSTDLLDINTIESESTIDNVVSTSPTPRHTTSNTEHATVFATETGRNVSWLWQNGTTISDDSIGSGSGSGDMAEYPFASTKRRSNQNGGSQRKRKKANNRNHKRVHSTAATRTTTKQHDYSTSATLWRLYSKHRQHVAQAANPTISTYNQTNSTQKALVDGVALLRINANVNSSESISSFRQIEASSVTTMPTTSSRATVSPATTETRTTTKKSLRKATQKLLATPFHRLTYVRNEAGEIDIDNIDNISVYPDLMEEQSSMNPLADLSAAAELSSYGSGNSRLTIVSGYLPTSATDTLPESLRIAKAKINRQRRRLLRQHGSNLSA